MKLLQVFKQSSEEKLVNSILSFKSRYQPEETFKDLFLLSHISEQKSDQIISVIVKKLNEKDEKKFSNLMVLIYRYSDQDATCQLLRTLISLNIKDVFLSKIPLSKNLKTQKIMTTFARHLDNKLYLLSQHNRIIHANVVVTDLINEDEISTALELVEFLLKTQKNITQLDFNNEEYYKNNFPLVDILLLELTILYVQTNMWFVMLVNAIDRMTETQIRRFTTELHDLDVQKHSYITVINLKNVREYFEVGCVVIPSLSYLPSGPLQKFLQKYADNLKNGKNSDKVMEQIISFNTTFKADIEQNVATLHPFVIRNWVSVNLADSTDTSNSISRSASTQIIGPFDKTVMFALPRSSQASPRDKELIDRMKPTMSFDTSSLCMPTSTDHSSPLKSPTTHKLSSSYVHSPEIEGQNPQKVVLERPVPRAHPIEFKRDDTQTDITKRNNEFDDDKNVFLI
ncbi:hypothetical protein EIN_026220 [Entamoeba invadens IP1]|uniref:hypothetical protein n=1 Tax=Entamoeba invadens IP1 TaxID=370355 RepID=UPI0002C3E431|nr:hypothetical protein EIN_026220 [Entamoeba invadens IP1]ELP90773.1 hypothetical protein EIN_026220 [Entamoeba invadens IP1]|eukprot:XP_004257544.1 hypothetical protein EIN_026220 [Entamoeba invadens IP1]